MKSGKKVQYIDSNNYIKETDETSFSYDVFDSVLPDPIRYFSKNYWTLHKKNLVFANSISKSSMFDIKYVDDSSIELQANKQKFSTDSINDLGILVREFDESKWEIFLNNNLPSTSSVFEDFNISFPEPLDLYENPGSEEKNLSFIKKDQSYNFFSAKYEAVLNDRRVDVAVLPSIFNLLNDKKLDTRTYEENLSLTLGGLIPDDYAESLFLARDYSETVKNYFDVYAEKYTTPEALTVIQQIIKDNKNKQILPDQLKLLEQNTFIPFPFYVQSKFSNLANEKNSFIHQIEEYPNVKKGLNDYILYNNNQIKSRNFIYSSDYLEERQIKEYDLKRFIESGISGSVSVDEPDDLAPITLANAVEYGKFVDYIKKNIKNQTRKYSDLNKVSSNDQLICYKIEKRQFGYTSNNLIQTFWVSPSESSVVNFIDTQLKYGTDYYYTISAFMMVVGNSYSYLPHDYSGANGELERLSDIANGIWKIKVKNNTSYKIFEIPFAKWTGIIHENPYTKPVVSLQKDKDNLRINILPSSESSLGEIKIIESADFKILESIRLSQNNPDGNQVLSVSNKQPTVSMQIYRSATRPTDAVSFQGKLYKTIILENDATFTDFIVPDVKHYYAFRYLNQHGTPSDISSVYEATMKNEDGYSYLDIKEINLDMQINKSLSKNMKRYLLVRPSMLQTVVTTSDEINSTSDIFLGPNKEPVWNKDFVLRITSKKTNRVLQFNLINRKKE